MTSSIIEESDKEFSGNELDESEDEETYSIQEPENSNDTERRGSRKSRLTVFITIGLCFLAGIGYLCVKGKHFIVSSGKLESVPRVNRFAIEIDQLLVLDSFVIPINKNMKFSYVSLSISFNLPNRELKREMTQKKTLVRGIIYDILRKEINKIQAIPPLQKVKKLILRGVNTVLSAGKVREVYITQFLPV